MALKSGNPALSVKTFEGLGESADPMALAGTVNKTAVLLTMGALACTLAAYRFEILRLLGKRR